MVHRDVSRLWSSCGPSIKDAAILGICGAVLRAHAHREKDLRSSGLHLYSQKAQGSMASWLFEALESVSCSCQRQRFCELEVEFMLLSVSFELKTLWLMIVVWWVSCNLGLNRAGRRFAIRCPGVSSS